jgi:hypothetical protein
MTINDDLSSWGEPPADEGEQVLADVVGQFLERALRPEEGGGAPAFPSGAEELVRTGTWLDELVESVVEHSGILEDAPPKEALPALLPERAGPAPVTLALLLHQELGGGRRVCIPPAQASTIVLRTGDRVRLEVLADLGGHVVVFNVGPRDGVNLLYPDRAGLPAPPIQPGVPLHVSDIELVPPPGRERLAALWTRVPLERDLLAGLAGRTGLERLRALLAQAPAEDWYAVVVEVEHGSE